ncbi:MAG: hypothetical protein WC549_05750, partial [Actinomycetota bacterium]
NQNKSILEKIESIDVGDVKIDDSKIEDINLNENIDIKTIALTFKKMKYYYEKIINNDEKIIKFYIDILKYWIGNYEKNAKELISNLKENINIKFIIFVNRFFRHYFNKYN